VRVPRRPVKCVVEGCWRDAQRRGRCWACYRYWRRNGRDRDVEVIEQRQIARNARRLEDELWAANVRRLVAQARSRLDLDSP
jgi:hypothetical protein